MSHDYAFEIVRTKTSLIPFKKWILKLFNECFGRELQESVWDWAYLLNPCGDPYVCLVFYEGGLVGHYAAIPQRYVENNHPGIFLLSMTTMVHPRHRRAGLFQKAAEMVYAKAGADDVCGVLGFPNKNSLPGFKKRLGWTIMENVSVARVACDRYAPGRSRGAINRMSPDEFISSFTMPDDCSMNLGNSEFFRWRINKPGSAYFFGRLEKRSFVFKPFRNELDVVFHDTMEQEMLGELCAMAAAEGYETLTFFDNGHCGLSVQEKVDYVFGFKNFSGEGRSFHTCLLMSDVF